MKVPSDFPVDMLVRDEREVARRVKQTDLSMLEITERGASYMKPSTREWIKKPE